MKLEAAVAHLQAGDWQRAHAIVQEDESTLGCWAHGIVHMMEGDIANARYWYRRTPRDYPASGDPSAEIEALRRAITDSGTPTEMR